MNELLPVLTTIKLLSLQLVEAIDILTKDKEEQVQVEEKVEVTPVEVKKEVTLIEVRKVLATLSKNGYTNDVKALLKKYGADKLSEIDPSNYEAILSDAEVLNNNG